MLLRGVWIISLSAVSPDSGNLSPSSSSSSSSSSPHYTKSSQCCWKGENVGNRVLASRSLIPLSCNFKPSLSSLQRRTRTTISCWCSSLGSDSSTKTMHGLVQWRRRAGPAAAFRAESFWKQTFLTVSSNKAGGCCYIND